MNYKLIALDVDGTLLNDHYEVSEANRRSLTEANREGAVIVLCTGRGPGNTLPLLELLGLEGVVITHNGAAIVESKTRKVLHHYRMELDELMPILEYCRSHKVHYDVCTAFEIFVDRWTDLEKDMYKKYMIYPIEIPDVTAVDEPKLKVTLFGTGEQMDQVERDWPAIGCSLIKVRSGLHFVDIIHPEATKGNALKMLASKMGISRDKVMAIGNYYNDIAMIEWAGLGIAVDNSPEDVKAHADAVTSSNNDDGVAHALEKYAFPARR